MKTNIQLIDDVSTCQHNKGQVTFRLRYTQNGKVILNKPLPNITAPFKINKKDIKAVMDNPAYKAAWDALTAAKKALGKNITPINDNQPKDFFAWADREVSYIANEKTRKKNELIFKKLKAFIAGDRLAFSEVNSDLCLNFQAYLHSAKSTKKKNAKLENHAAELFRKFMIYVNRGKGQGFISGDFGSVKRNQKRVNYEVGVILTEEEKDILFATPCPNKQVEQISKLQYYTGGQRCIDIMLLTWDKIVKQKDGYFIPVIIQSKTKSKVYDISLDFELIDGIAGERTGLLFKEKISNDDYYDALKEWAKRAGINKEMGKHVFRRSAATHLFREGINIVKIAKLLGHLTRSGIARPMQTMQYIGVQLEDMKPCFDILRKPASKEHLKAV